MTLRIVVRYFHAKAPSVILDACPRRLSPTFSIGDLIEDPVSLLFPSHNQHPWIPAFAGMTEKEQE